VHCIPKIPGATNLKDWRPISLLSALQKFYTAVLVTMAKPQIPALPSSYGYVEGCQPLFVIEQTRALFAKSHEWRLPLAAFSGDVHKAFDHMVHAHIFSTLVWIGVCFPIAVALLREARVNFMQVHVAGVASRKILMGRGGKQGGTETPFLWLILLTYITREVEAQWKTENNIDWLDMELAVKMAIQKYVDDIWGLHSSVLKLLLRFAALTDALCSWPQMEAYKLENHVQ